MVLLIGPNSSLYFEAELSDTHCLAIVISDTWPMQMLLIHIFIRIGAPLSNRDTPIFNFTFIDAQSKSSSCTTSITYWFFDFLKKKKAPHQKLVLASGTHIRINTVKLENMHFLEVTFTLHFLYDFSEFLLVI